MSDNDDLHWAKQTERGSLFWMRVGFAAVRLLGRRTLAPVVWLVTLYFYLSRRVARRAIADYQRRLTRSSDPSAVTLPRCFPVYRQYLQFGVAMLDKLDVWHGRITRADLVLKDPHALHPQMGKGRGQILLTSHLGNVDVTRALAQHVPGLTLNVLVHHRNALRFNQIVKAIHTGDPANTRVQLLEVSELNAAVMMDLAQRLESGEWLAIAGDRLPIRGERSTPVQFLGGVAHLPQGAWLIASLLRCPVNLLMCLRNPKGSAKRFTVVMERLASDTDWPRQQRAQHIAACSQHYADRLADYCRQAPLQWFNFYPFWTTRDAHTTSAELS